LNLFYLGRIYAGEYGLLTKDLNKAKEMKAELEKLAGET